MEAFLTPVILTVVVALISAILLTVAAKVFFVETDETEEKIRECLPGANCGGCGYAGCDAYAKALAQDKSIPVNLCIPGGKPTAQLIGKILGVEAGDVEPHHSTVLCSGLTDVEFDEMDYQGISSCSAAKQFFQGPEKCKFGCLGYGDCVKVCPTQAIQICNGLSKIDFVRCVGCKACVKACPQGILAVIPSRNRYYVGCSNCEKGSQTAKACNAGCIGCKMCEKTCKFDAIHVENFHAVIDYDKCKNCGMCAKACPRHIIHQVPKLDTINISKVK